MHNIKSYKDLDVWKKAIKLTKLVYLTSKTFPKEEQYGLTVQVRRSMISIPSNIAEGKMRQSTAEYLRFLYIALGSCGELDTQLIIAQELGYIDTAANAELLEEIDHIARMLRNLIKNLRE